MSPLVTSTGAGRADSPILERDSAIPLVPLSVSSTRGSLIDPPGKEGAARLLLRLMRRSGRGKNADQAEELIDGLGGHLGGDVNRSSAGFHGGAIRRSTKPFLDFVFATICEPGLPADEFAQLVTESRAALVERLDDDRSLARSFWLKKVFEGHPYARPSGGTQASLARLELRDLTDLYPRLFSREAVRFAFAGQVEASEALEAAARISQALPAGDAAVADPEHPSGPSGRHLVFVDKPDRTQTQIVIGGLGTHPGDADHTALHVGNTIFGGTFTARLTQEVRAKRGWSYGAYSSIPFDRRRQTFSMWTFPQAADAAACIRLELELLERWVEQGVTARELGAAKKYLIKSHAFAVDTAAKRAGLALDEALYELPARYQADYLARVTDVTLEQVNAAIRTRISKDNLVVTVLGTHKDIGKAISASVAGLSSESVVRYDSEP